MKEWAFMLPPPETQSAAHAMSQLVYLDTVPAMERGGEVTVGDLADYYLGSPVGRVYLKARFGGIEREYTLWKEFLDTGVTSWRDWRVTDILDDNGSGQSGFYGCTYRSPGRERVLAFRGSENLGNPLYKNDYGTDLALAYIVPTPQQAVAARYLRQYGNGAPFYLTGHSLGGNLALYAAVSMLEGPGREMLGCFAFNAPGFNDEFLRLYSNILADADADEKLFVFQNEFDIVSSLLKDIAQPLIVASGFDPHERTELADLLYPHSNFMFRRVPDGGFVLSESGEKSRLCKLANSLTRLFLTFPAFVRREIGEIILGILYAPPKPEKAKRYIMEAVTKYAARNEELLKVHVNEVSVLYGAESLSGIGAPELIIDLYGSQGLDVPELARILLILTEILIARSAITRSV